MLGLHNRPQAVLILQDHARLDGVGVDFHGFNLSKKEVSWPRYYWLRVRKARGLCIVQKCDMNGKKL